MKILQFTIKNYRSLREVKSELGQYTTFVGENGSGKTTILEGLYLFFKDFAFVGGASSPMLHDISSWHNKETIDPVEFILKIELDDEECKEVFPRELLDKIIQKYEGRHKEITVHRLIAKPGDSWKTDYLKVADMLLAQGDQLLSSEELTKSLTVAMKAYLFSPTASQSNLVGARLVVIGDKAYHMNKYTDDLVREGRLSFEKLADVDYREWVEQSDLAIVEEPPRREEVDACFGEEISVTPQILQDIQNKIVEKIKGKFSLIPATRDEKVAPGAHDSFLDKATIVDPLANLLRANERRWRKTRDVIEALLSKRLETATAEVCTWEQDLAFPVPINLIGGGEQEVIGLIWQIYSASEDIVAIEEPETHLHYNLSRKLFELLREESKEKQFVIATHSEHFADRKELSNNWKVDKKAKETKIWQMKEENDLMEAFRSMGAEPIDRGFPNKVLFVAGKTEMDGETGEGVLSTWAKKMGLDMDKVRIDPLEGEHDKRKVKAIKAYIDRSQAQAFLVVDEHASDDVKRALDEEHRLILDGTIEDCYPIPIVAQVLNELYDLDIAAKDIDPEKPRVDEIKRILRDKTMLKHEKAWKVPVGHEVAKRMTEEDIPEKVRGFIDKIGE